MADQDAQDRNLPASAKKIARSRAEGQVPRSRDLPHFAMMVAGGAVLAVGGPLIVERLRLMLGIGLHFDARLLARPGFMGERLVDMTLAFAAVMGPVAALLLLAAVASLLAARLFKRGSPPTPELAIEEAKRTRAELEAQKTQRDQVGRSLERGEELKA